MKSSQRKQPASQPAAKEFSELFTFESKLFDKDDVVQVLLFRTHVIKISPFLLFLLLK